MTDILIRMEMPKHCINCPCMVDKYGGDNCCLQSEEANEKITSWDDMKAGCPLVELHAHGDLIDRDKLLEEDVDLFIEYDDFEDESGCSTDVIRNAPVVIPSNKEDTK